MKGLPYFYYMDPIEGTDHDGKPLQPDFCVDISSTMELKKQMLACHESQREWLRSHHGIDEYLDSMVALGKHQGEQSGFPYAEGFRQHVGHPFPQKNILATLLPENQIKTFN